VLFGGRTPFAPTTVARSRDRLYADMVAIHPQLAGVRVERAWGGNVALTADRMPHSGRHPDTGVVYAMGWCGTGVAMSTYAGREIGRWLATGGAGDGPASLAPMADRPWPAVPLPARRPFLLPVAGWRYQARDRLGL
jgi:glycine/D-amino acid oxidase-like deaminating enzyme